MMSRSSRIALCVGLLAAAACNKGGEASAQPAASAAPLVGRRVDVTASNDGYSPKEIAAKKGEDLVLRFTRTTKSECLSEVVFPSLNIKKELPLNQAVEIAVKADKEGKIPFQCGMAMVFGSIVVSGS
jgi:plastocyanin domain-containing protein